MRFLLLLALLWSGARSPAAELALVGATVFPDPYTAPLADAVVIIRDRTIVAVGPRAATPIPDGAEVIDCTGQFITAGFWNCHVHLLTPDLLGADEKSASTLNPTLEAMFTRWGFTTVFDIASPLSNSLALAARIDAGELSGPRILSTGEPLWTRTPIYVLEYLVAHRIAIPPTTTAEAAVAHVNEKLRHAQGVKLFTGSMQGQGVVANMDVELARAAVQAAHARGLPVFAHPHNTAGLEVAIVAGVDVLAHTAPMSPAWTPEFASRLVQAQIALVPTLTLFRSEGQQAKVPPDEIARWVEHAIGQVRAFRSAGGEILFGTDIGYITDYDTAEEFGYLARAGLDFPATLRALTTAPAARLGRSADARITSGSAADLVILADDPRVDLTALARVRATLRQGKFIYRAP